jgi:D-3-phosphoglycerate dehydrogenase
VTGALPPEVLVVNHRFEHLDAEQEVLAPWRLLAVRCEGDADLLAHGDEVRAILVTSTPRISRAVMERLPKLAVVCRYGIGVDNVDVEAASECGIAVCNVPDYAVDEVAAHAIALALALVRQVVAGARVVESGSWSVGALAPVTDLRETTLGLLGFGAIGRRACAKALGLGMRVLVHDPYADEADVTAAGAEPAGFEALMRAADVVSLHLPLTPATRGIIGAPSLALMKPTAYLVNTARGGLVDEAALAQALDDRRIAGAALDVLGAEPPAGDHPLLSRPDVLVTPHMAWYSTQAMARLQRGAAEQVRAVLEGRAPQHQVNHVPLPRVA